MDETDSLVQLELPKIEGITVPRYVKQLAAGKMNKTIENIQEINPNPTSAKFNLNNIQTELENLARSDSILIRKYVSIYEQIKSLKQEYSQNSQNYDYIPSKPIETESKPTSTQVRSSEEKKKYACRRMDIPTQSESNQKPQKRHSSSLKNLRLSLNSASSLSSTGNASSIYANSCKTGSVDIPLIPIYASGKSPEVQVKSRTKGSIRSSLKLRKKKNSEKQENSRLGVTRQEMARYDSLNSVFSGSGSAGSGSQTGSGSGIEKRTGSGSESRSSSFDEVQVQDFEEIEMPQEGELSNLDVNWFLNYKCSTLTTNKHI